MREKGTEDAVKFLKETDDGGTRISMLNLSEQAEQLFLSNDKIAFFAVKEADKKCKTIDAFADDFEKKIAVGAVNAAKNWGDLSNILKEQASLLGIDECEDAFKKFSSISEIAADTSKELIKQLPFKDEKSLCEAFKKAVKNAESDNSKGSGGGSGVSGGGFSGGSSSVIIPSGNTGAGTNSGENDKPSGSIKDGQLLYSDVNTSHWAYNSIMAMTEKGFINGDGSGAFYPERKVTREEFVKMLVLAMGMDIDGDYKIPYSDVSADDWFRPYVAAAYNSGLVLGVEETVFGTGDVITREQMAVICHRAAKMTGKTLGNNEVIEFNDAKSISEYAREAVNALSSAGILKGMGDNSFDPKGEVTRSQAANVIFDIYRAEVRS